MKIAVVGLGAIGGLMAARLFEAGHEVSALARGATLKAVADHGLRVVAEGIETHAAIRASDDAQALGPQDLVVIALKGQALPGVVGQIQPLLGQRTVVMPAMNGVPWWFLQTARASVGLAQANLESVDPGGVIARTLPLERVVGCVVHLTASSPQPGLIRHGFGHRLIVGEPAGGSSTRVDAIVDALSQASFKAEASADIRYDIWYKLWGNMTVNPVSALTGAATDRILDDPLVHSFILRTMEEAALIGSKIGCAIAQTGQDRMAVTRQLGGFKTSMLQDSLAGRALELDALVGAVHEIGTRLQVSMPNIEVLLGLTRLMARERGLYPA
jgi:2-dehydropantoate 2-reductase